MGIKKKTLNNLWKAVADGSTRRVFTCLQSGLDINVRMYGGRTVLHQATTLGNLEMVAYLLKKGADAEARIGANGDTSVDIAKKNQFTEIKALLESHGGKSTAQLAQEEKLKRDKEIKDKVEILKNEEWAKDLSGRTRKYLATKDILTFEKLLEHITGYPCSESVSMEIGSVQRKIKGKSAKEEQKENREKEDREERQLRLSESGGYSFHDWDGVVWSLESRLNDFGINFENMFHEVEICGLEVRLHSQYKIKEISYWPEDEIVERSVKLQRWLDSHSKPKINSNEKLCQTYDDSDQRFVDRYQFHKGQLYAMEALYENRDNKNVLSAILIAAALFPFFGSNRSSYDNYPSDYWPPRELVRDLFNWCLEIYKEQSKEGEYTSHYDLFTNPWFTELLVTCTSRDGDNYKILGLNGLINNIAEDVASMFHQYKLVYVTRTEQRNSELDIAIKVQEEKEENERLERKKEFEERERILKEEKQKELEEKKKIYPRYGEFESIEKSELLEMVWSNPLKKIADLFGVNYHEINDRCRRLDIKKPPSGVWQRVKLGNATMLHIAAEMYLIEVVELFLKKGLNVNPITKNGETPLDKVLCDAPWISEEEKKPTVEILLKHGGKTGAELKSEGK